MGRRPEAGRFTSNADAHTVYRYFDHAGHLIYVGVTGRGLRRQDENERRSEFYPFMASSKATHDYPTRLEALKAEADLIRRLKPPFNKTHNPDWPRGRDAYIKAATPALAARRADPAAALAEDIGHQLPLKVIAIDGDGGLTLRASVEHAPVVRRWVAPIGTTLVNEAGDLMGTFRTLDGLLCDARMNEPSPSPPTGALASIKPMTRAKRTEFEVVAVEIAFSRPPRWFAGGIKPPVGVA